MTEVTYEGGCAAEKSNSPSTLATNCVSSTTDPNLVDWSGENDPSNAQNWSLRQKWIVTFMLSTFGFTSSLSSSMVAPCLTTIARDLEIKNAFESQLVMTAYVLSWGIGPVILGPLSEVYGRAPIQHLCNLAYIVFNLACGLSRNVHGLIAFRILSGLGSSAPLAIGDGLLRDVWPNEQLGIAVAIEAGVSLLGPAAGPILGGVINRYTTWRWTFYGTSIATGLVSLIGLFSFPESYGPYILRTKARRLREQTGNSLLYTKYDLEHNVLRMLTLNLSRPVILLATQIIVQLFALFDALIFGLLYIILTSLATVIMEFYNENSLYASLHYIAIGAGLCCGAQGGAYMNDYIYAILKRRNTQIGAPEYHLPLLGVGCLLNAAGFLWFGWSVQARLFWIMPDIGAFLVSAGYVIAHICVQTYTIEAYPRYTASVMSVYTLSRSLAGFGFPLFSPYLFTGLGYGWGGSLLAVISLLVGLPMSLMFWRLGHILRQRSPFARD